MIRDAGRSVRLGLITPTDRNFVDPDDAAVSSGSGRDPDSTSVSGGLLAARPADSEVDGAALDLSRDAADAERSLDSAELPTMSRHWAFRCRRKREKNS